MFLFNKQIEKKNPQIKTITSVRDRPVKSIFNSISRRIIGTFDTIVISYFISGKVIIAFSKGSFEIFTKMFLYFLHERLWAVIRLDRMLVLIRRRTS